MSSTLLTKEGQKVIVFKLKEYCDEHGVSLYWISKETGIRRATLYNMANNKHDSINLSYLGAIMNVLNITDMNLLLEKID